MPHAIDPRPDLWRKAIDSLGPAVIESLQSVGTAKRDVALAALRAAEGTRHLCLKERWRAQRSPAQGDVIVHDVLEKIIFWIQRFRDVGDQNTDGNARPTALPWAAVRFLLTNKAAHRGMHEHVETIVRLMATSHKLENVCLSHALAENTQVCDALVQLYTAILSFLAHAVDASHRCADFAQTTGVLQLINDDAKNSISEAEVELRRLATVINAEGLVGIGVQAPRLSDPLMNSRIAIPEEQYSEALTWLSQAPYSRHHELQRENRLPGTAQWLLQQAAFRSWISTSESSMFLLNGISGCGKSMLCSAIIDQYQHDKVKIPDLAPLAYFYCTLANAEPERSSPEGVLRSLARQLTLSESPEPAAAAHSAVLAMHTRYADQAKAEGSAMERASMATCIELILSALEDNPATLIVDGLGEVDEPWRLVDALDILVKKARNVLKVLITTGNDLSIFTMLPEPLVIHITDDLNKADVRLFAAHAVENAVSQGQLLEGHASQALEVRLVDDLVFGARESFLWVTFQLSHLCSIKNETDMIAASAGASGLALNTLYKAAYDRIESAGEMDREIALRSLTWLLYAGEQLTPDAFRSAVVSGTQLEEPTVEAIVANCHGFVRIDKHSMTLRLAQDSVRKFLLSQETFDRDRSHGLLALSCLDILSHPPEHEITAIQPGEGVYDYAVVFCGHHISAAEPRSITQALLSFSFDDCTPSSSAKMWMSNCGVAWNTLPTHHPQRAAMELASNKQCLLLFPICTFGLLDVLKSSPWLAGMDWNQQSDDHGHTALYAAAFFGHTQVVAFLLDQGADINLKCGARGTALRCAASRGHTEVFELLLSRDAHSDNNFDDILHAACRSGHEKIVSTFLDQVGFTLNQAQFESALEAVCEARFPHNMKMLFDNPVSRAIEPSKMQQLVTKAIISGNVKNCKYLSQEFTLADLTAIVPDGVAQSAMHGQEAMTNHLLSQGLDVNHVGEHGTPLRCASLNGSDSICHILLSRGAAVNGNERFGSALHAASMKGHLHIVRLLLDAGADVNIQGGHYGNPLQAAAYQGHKEVVSMLINAGANLQQKGFSKDAYHAAAEGGHHEILKVLLSSGFALSEPYRGGGAMACMAPPPPRNLLRESSPDGRKSMRGWRQRYGSRDELDDDDSDEDEDKTAENENEDWVDVSNPTPSARPYVRMRHGHRGRRDEDGENYPLEAAAGLGHIETVREILAQHDYLGLDDSSRSKALVAACKYGHQGIAEELLSRMEEDNMPLRKALQEAASHSHVAVVRMLLAYECEAQSQLERIKATLLSSIAGDQVAFREILVMAEKELTLEEVDVILLECLPVAAKADRADVIRAILSRKRNVEQKTIIEALMDTCKAGNLRATEALHEALRFNDSSELSPRRYSKFIRLAVENGHEEIVRHLLPMFAQHGKAKYLDHMVLVAASCGYLDIVEFLLEKKEWDDLKLLQQALNVAAHNGHEGICAFLLSRGIDPRTSAPTITWGDIAVDRGRSRFDRLDRLHYSDGGSSDSEVEAVRRKKRGEKFTQPEPPPQGLPLLAGKARALNAIESCVSGFRRFESRHEWFMIHNDSFWKEAGRKGQASALKMLLESVDSFADPLWDETVCAAAELCPPRLVRLILEKGANANARHGSDHALVFAARRERLCFPVVQALVQHGGDQNLSEHDLRKVLDQASSFFPLHTGRPDGQGGLFKKSKSLNHVFTTGPGAVFNYILQRLPEEQLSSDEHSVILQCAAAAGRTDIVGLLLDHQVNVNSAGSYFGTALQAASRFAHEATVKRLLENGADPNIRQGRHHTALRAAVLGGSLETVTLLLQAGADTELSAHWDYTPETESDPTALQLAVQHKHLEIVKSLIAAGADIHVYREAQQPLLVQACRAGDIALICTLLEAGTDVNTQGHKRKQWGSKQPEDGSGVHAAIDKGRGDVIELLHSKWFCLSADFGEFTAPLVFAARKGDVGVVDILLRLDPSVSDDTLIQASREALRWSNCTAAERLVYHRPSVLDKDEKMGLFWSACSQGNENIVEFFLEELSYRGGVQAACTAVLERPPSGSNAAVFETLLEYAPCTVDFFVEASARGFVNIVKLGLEQGIPVASVDKNGRSAIQAATIQGSAGVVQLLLRSGADPDTYDTAYGMPLMVALEACSVKNFSIKDLPEDLQGYARSLMPNGFDRYHFSGFARRSSRKLTYQQAQYYTRTVQVLLESGASPNPPQGPFGGSLTLAAFTGIRKIYDVLLRSGAGYVTGGYLHSPLRAAIEGNHMDLAKDIRKFASNLTQFDGVEVGALHKACDKSDLPAVKLLLRNGADPEAKDENGNTPLRTSLERLAKTKRFHSAIDRNEGRSHGDVIAHLILDANTTVKMTDQDLIAAAKIELDEVRVGILQKMIPRAEHHYFPEEAFVSLIQHDRWSYRDKGGMVQQLLDEKRIQRITTPMLAAAESPKTITSLLEYDPSYIITPETMDTVVGGHGMYNRQIASVLLEWDEAFIPSASNIVTVLNQRPTSEILLSDREKNSPHILEMMFARNPQLTTTEEMLIAASHVADLKILLARTTVERGLVTEAVMASLAKKYSSDSRDLLKMLLAFDSKISIPEETADHHIYSADLEGLELLWKHDSTLRLSENALSSLVSKHRSEDGGRVHDRGHSHADVVKVLREHRGQWEFSKKVREAIDHKFQEQSQQGLKAMYYELMDEMEL